MQTEFEKLFPYLKLEFYDHFYTEENEVICSFSYDLPIKSVSKKAEPKVLKIYRQMTTSQLQNAFQITFGLSVQVFRKAGNIWIQTISADKLTLEELNEIAQNNNFCSS